MTGKSHSHASRGVVRWSWLAACLLLAAFFAFRGATSADPAPGKAPAHSAASAQVNHSTKNIEEIRVGDTVLARSDETGEHDPKRVTQVFRHTVDHLRILTVRGAQGIELQQIRTTDEHPFWVDGLGWTEAGQIRPGQRLVQSDGALATVVRSRYEPHPEGIEVFNFEVEDYHTYFVAQTDADALLWVHNKAVKPRKPPTPKAPRPTTGPLRRRMPDPPLGMKKPQAHHDLAQKFRDKFEKVGLDIDDPAYGRWVEGSPVGNHQRWSPEFNREWDTFFQNNPNATADEILDCMQRLRDDIRFR